MRYTIYCIFQPGELEIQSLLLLSSLRQGLKGDFHLYVCHPVEPGNEIPLQPETEQVLNELEISRIRMSNKYLQEIHNPEIGDIFSNKYFALPHLPESDYTLFFDSDMLLIKELDLAAYIHGADFLAKPVCYMNETRWDDLYALFGMEVPEHRVISTVDHKEGPPYFNGGMFCIKSSLSETFSSKWLETFIDIKNSKIMHDNPVNREQAALAITVSRLQMSYSLLSEELNFPARSKQLRGEPYPYIVHYHDPESIYKNCKVLKFVYGLFEVYPALRELASRMDNWKILTAPPLNVFHLHKRIRYQLKGIYQSMKFI